VATVSKEARAKTFSLSEPGEESEKVFFGKEQPMNHNAMTPVRACQVATKLLKDEAAALTADERDAIQVLRDATAKLIVHGLQRRR
jgi:hypothetical protein